MEKLSFRVSSGLKNIIGRELITDKIIAVFEIVKNSYDAGASRVDISFNDMQKDNSSIVISDNGCGMTKNDIINKWLFVAYSEKKYNRSSYVENISKKRTYAGAKGVGRFSCDRLGDSLNLYSKQEIENHSNLLTVNWNDFEKDAQEDFAKIAVYYRESSGLPSGYNSGTTLIISGLREKWTREDILQLKRALVKLINPYETDGDVFRIYLHCTEELDEDNKETNEKDKINTEIKNYIFETLNLKTTQISVRIPSIGNIIETKINDRGIFLFNVTQKNRFTYLRNIDIELFYLNRAAKYNFHKAMGVPCVDFGSVFVYKNGFRIMPYGEPGADFFKIDRRKAQGYNRFLGTRDLMGRITILGDNPDFIETSSRDGGFIKTEAYLELEDFFKYYVLLPLEKYVVGLINWGDEDKTGSVNPKDIGLDIIKYITNYQKNGELLSVEINDELYKFVENKSNQNNEIINQIKAQTDRYNNPELNKLLDKIQKQNKTALNQVNEYARHISKVEQKLETKEKELENTKKQNLFLKNLSDPKFENATEALHLMNTYGKSIKLNVKRLRKEIYRTNNVDLINKTEQYIYEINKATQKINTTYNLTFSADYDMREQTQIINIYDFLIQYISNALFSKTGEIIKVKVQPPSNSIFCKVNPLDFGMIIENLIFNSYKANAKNLLITLTKENDGFVSIVFLDDGNGISDSVSDPNRLFELGFSTTNGTGVGLYFVNKTVEGWGGKTEIMNQCDGFGLKVRIKYEY